MLTCHGQGRMRIKLGKRRHPRVHALYRYALGRPFGPALPDKSKVLPSAAGTRTNTATATAPATAIPPVTMKALVKLPVHCTR